MSTTIFAPPPPEPTGRLSERVAESYTVLYITAEDPFSIKQFIERSQVTLQKPLREDAKYLLLLNFSGMIMRPVAMSGRLTPEQLLDAVISDIDAIVLAAEAIAPNDVISGHQIINALTNVWGQLRTTAYNIWD